jgi:hypothetical protein
VAVNTRGSKGQGGPCIFLHFTKALEEKENGTALPFAIKIKATGEYAGSTRFGNIDTTQ